MTDHQTNPIIKIINTCFSSNKLTFTELSEDIIANFNNINLDEHEINVKYIAILIESKGRKLILTLPKTIEQIRNKLYIRLKLNKLVKEKSYTTTEYVNCSFTEIENLIKICVDILVKKQKKIDNINI